MSQFDGFPAGCLPFLAALRQNNNRAWFNDNKQRYETEVREPALAFIESMGPELQKVSPHFRATSKKVGGSLMRVYRDIRFSRDKTPYKINIGMQFRHELGKDVHAPGFYLHIEPDNCFVGVGIWHPESKVLAKIRDFIVDNPASWKAANSYKPFKSNYLLAGGSLQRHPRGYQSDHPLIDDLKRKDFFACAACDDERIHTKDFSQFVAKRFKQAEPFMSYLCTALQVRY